MNTKITAVIVEDEKPARHALKDELAQHCPAVEVVGEAGSVTEAVALINRAKPMLIFLDVRLTDGLGLEVLQQIDHQQFHTIFTTAYHDWAINAIKFNALDYLLKPIDGLELKEAVKKVEEHPTTAMLIKLQNLLSNQHLAAPEQKITFQTTDGLHIFKLGDIIRFQADVNYTMLFSTSRKLVFAKTLKEVESLLSDKGFLRVHQSHLVNLQHVVEYNKTGHYLLLDGDIRVPVSQRKKSEVLDKLV